MTKIIGQGNWGICGFVSVLNAIQQNAGFKEFGVTLTAEKVQDRLVAEVITYLKMTKVERPQITNEIMAFTKSFGTPFNQLADIDALIHQLETALRNAIKDGSSPASVIRSEGVGVAMTPNALADYLKFANIAFERKTSPTDLTEHGLRNVPHSVVGVGTGDKSTFGGLQHWVYINASGNLINWGGEVTLSRSFLIPKDLSFATYVTDVFQLSASRS